MQKKRTKFDMTTKDLLNIHCQKEKNYMHKVKIQKDSLLESILKKDEIDVKSVHHDIVKFELETLKISAFSDDGVIEAVEMPEKKFVVGVQWHPEYLDDENARNIRQAFIEKL